MASADYDDVLAYLNRTRLERLWRGALLLAAPRAGRPRAPGRPQVTVAGWVPVSTLYATLHTNRGDIRIELLPEPRAQDREQLRRAGARAPRSTRRRTRPARPRPVLRRRDLPPGDPRLHDPGRRPDRHRPRRPRATPSPTSSTRSCSSTGRTCWPWPTPGPAPTARSSSSPSGPTPHLNRKHTIFGEVADQAVPRRRRRDRRHRDRPVRPARRGRGDLLGQHRGAGRRAGLITA